MDKKKKSNVDIKKKLKVDKNKRIIKTKNENNNTNNNVIHINIGSSKLLKKNRKSSINTKKVEGVSSYSPLVVPYYRPPQNINTESIYGHVQQPYYNGSDNKNYFQNPEILSSNLNSNSKVHDDDQSSTLSVNSKVTDDEHSSLNSKVPDSYETPKFIDIYAEPKSLDMHTNTEYQNYDLDPDIKYNMNEDDEFKNPQPVSLEYKNFESPEVMAADIKNFDDQDINKKQMKSIINKENEENMKSLYDQYIKIYEENEADKKGISKIKYNNLRSKKKIKEQIDRIINWIPEDNLNASEKKTNEIKNQIKTNRKEKLAYLNNLYSEYQQNGGVVSLENIFDYNHDYSIDKTNLNDAIDEIEKKIELLKLRKRINEKKKHNKIELINFLNKYGIKASNKNTIEKLLEYINELEI